jgi:hypothetical protein
MFGNRTAARTEIPHAGKKDSSAQGNDDYSGDIVEIRIPATRAMQIVTRLYDVHLTQELSPVFHQPSRPPTARTPFHRIVQY